MDIIELPVEFIGRGTQKSVKFELIAKSEYCYLYKKDNVYEVFSRKLIHLYDFINNEQLEGMKVRYPKEEDFGKWAWCFITQKAALTKFLKLEEDEKSKISIKEEERIKSSIS